MTREYTSNIKPNNSLKAPGVIFFIPTQLFLFGGMKICQFASNKIFIYEFYSSAMMITSFKSHSRIKLNYTTKFVSSPSEIYQAVFIIN